MPRLSRVNFPRILRIRISDYALFPGSDDLGIDFVFQPGVSAIVGINGLGKTSMLRLLYGMLLGPAAPRADATAAGGWTHEIGETEVSYFADRVQDRAATAVAELTIAIDATYMSVSRQLRDLSLQRLTVNGVEQPVTEQAYQAEIVRATQLGSYYDFYAILEFVVFYLERRTALLWNPTSQFDVLRALFFDDAARDRTAHLTDSISQLDSQYRNRFYAFNKTTRRLKRLEQSERRLEGAPDRVAVLTAEYLRLTEQQSTDQVNLDDMLRERDRLSADAERLRIKNAEVRVELEAAEHSALVHLFPSLETAASYVLLRIAADAECALCGSVSVPNAKAIRDRLKRHMCPACESPRQLQERFTGAPLPPRKLDELRATLLQLRADTDIRTAELDQLQTHITSAISRRSAASRRVDDIVAELGRLNADVPAPDVRRLQSYAETEEAELRNDLAELEAQRTELRALLDDQQHLIINASETLRASFAAYATTFLAESCSLTFGTDKRRVGQRGEQFDFPRFQVQMTSGTFDTATTRYDEDDVSESQREFIDLSFRMALLTAAGGESASSMFVVETPESSLDSHFIARAGEMLRQFASRSQNEVIATTNLNRENMIAALLRSPGARPDDVRDRIFNLLVEGQENAALRDRRDTYVSQLNEAIADAVESESPRES